jgi:hypothetical protein
MVEYSEDNKELMENVLNPEKEYNMNILCGDYLEIEVKKEILPLEDPMLDII